MKNISMKSKKALEIEQALGTTIWNLPIELNHNVNYKELNILNNWEKYDDVTILETINITDYLKGDIYIINDASYINKIIFETSDKDIKVFTKSYLATYDYKGGLFDGDVYFISLESMNLINFHHEGIWFLYKLPLEK